MRRSAEVWARLVQDYLAVQEERDAAVYAAGVGVTLHALRWWLAELTACVGSGRERHRVWAPRGLETRKALERLQTSHRRRGATALPFAELSPREQAILREIGHDRCNLAEVIARRHWRGSADPVRQAQAAIRELAARGFLTVDVGCDDVVYLTRAGARAAGVRHPPRMHPRHLRHHLATLKAIEQYRDRIEATGGRFVELEGPRGERMPYQMEVHVQAMQRGGRRSRQGHVYGVAPDAVVAVALPDVAVQRVAIEYFTSAYSNGQIRDKAALQSSYDAVLQVADNATTAGRVQRLTGVECEVLG